METFKIFGRPNFFIYIFEVFQAFFCICVLSQMMQDSASPLFSISNLVIWFALYTLDIYFWRQKLPYIKKYLNFKTSWFTRGPARARATYLIYFRVNCTDAEWNEYFLNKKLIFTQNFSCFLVKQGIGRKCKKYVYNSFFQLIKASHIKAEDGNFLG